MIKHPIILFLKKLLLLLVFAVVTDFLFGLIYTPLFNKQKSGKYFTTTYAIRSTNKDVVILGNSHAAQHFNSHLLASQLRTTVFNFGNQAQSLLYYYPLLKSILLHHTPKIVVIN